MLLQQGLGSSKGCFKELAIVDFVHLDHLRFHKFAGLEHQATPIIPGPK